MTTTSIPLAPPVVPRASVAWRPSIPLPKPSAGAWPPRSAETLLVAFVGGVVLLVGAVAAMTPGGAVALAAALALLLIVTGAIAAGMVALVSDEDGEGTDSRATH